MARAAPPASALALAFAFAFAFGGPSSSSMALAALTASALALALPFDFSAGFRAPPALPAAAPTASALAPSALPVSGAVAFAIPPNPDSPSPELPTSRALELALGVAVPPSSSVANRLPSSWSEPSLTVPAFFLVRALAHGAWKCCASMVPILDFQQARPPPESTTAVGSKAQTGHFT